MKRVALALTMFASSSLGFTEREYQDAFTQWMSQHKMEFAPEEFFYRWVC